MAKPRHVRATMNRKRLRETARTQNIGLSGHYKKIQNFKNTVPTCAGWYQNFLSTWCLPKIDDSTLIRHFHTQFYSIDPQLFDHIFELYTLITTSHHTPSIYGCWHSEATSMARLYCTLFGGTHPLLVPHISNESHQEPELSEYHHIPHTQGLAMNLRSCLQENFTRSMAGWYGSGKLLQLMVHIAVRKIEAMQILDVFWDLAELVTS